MFFIASFFVYAELFFRQSIELYPSDLPAHISFGLDPSKTNYSIVYVILKLLYLPMGNTRLISLFLALVVLLTVFATFFLLKYLIKDVKQSHLMMLAIMVNLVAPILPHGSTLGPASTVGFQNPFVLHNSTYLLMKLVGIVIILLFFKMRENYLEEIKRGQWLLLATGLTLINAIKPNFIVIFAPAVFIVFIVDFVKSRGKKWRNILLLGMAFLPSFLVLVFQYFVLFNEAAAGGNQIGFSFGYFISLYLRYPVVNTLQTLAFPVLILIFNFKELLKNKVFSFSWLMWVIAFIQFIFIIETGNRMNDGNWTWGAPFAVFILFISSIYMLSLNLKDKQFLSEKHKTKKIYFITAFILLLAHIVSGLVYLIMLFLGMKY